VNNFFYNNQNYTSGGERIPQRAGQAGNPSSLGSNNFTERGADQYQYMIPQRANDSAGQVITSPLSQGKPAQHYQTTGQGSKEKESDSKNKLNCL